MDFWNRLSSLSTTITKLEKDLDAERGKKKEAVAKYFLFDLVSICTMKFCFAHSRLSKIVEVSKERDSLLKECDLYCAFLFDGNIS